MEQTGYQDIYYFPTVTETKIIINTTAITGHVQPFTSVKMLVTSLSLQRHVRGTTNLEKTHRALILAAPKISLCTQADLCHNSPPRGTYVHLEEKNLSALRQ